MAPTDTPLALRLAREAVKARIFGDDRLSSRIGRYALLRRLGAGGVGVVYSAYDDELDRKVALKLVAADRLGPATVARVRREAQALARLSHPNVVHVYEVGEVEDHAYVAMEFVAGQTLRAYQEAPGRRAIEILDAYVAAGQGLAAAHAAGLVHRDFKPENALVGDDGRVRVVDFGLALVRSPEGAAAETPDPVGSLGQVPRDRSEQTGPQGQVDGARLTASGALVGTPAYMAPEQLDGGEADARSDLFSFCAALYEALHGRRPFDGGDAAALRRAIAAGVASGPTPADLPRGVHPALLRGLADDPAARWPGMEPLLAALRRRPERTRRRTIAAILSVLALGTCLFGYVAWRDAHRDEDLDRAQARARAAEAAQQAADAAAARSRARDLARRLVAASLAAAGRDHDAAILHAIAAIDASRAAGDPVLVEAEEALRDALDGVKAAALVDPEGGATALRSAVLSADGGRAATLDAGGVLRLWELGGGAPQLRLRLADRQPLAFAADGRLYAVDPAGALVVVDADASEAAGAPRALVAPVRAAWARPEGGGILAGFDRGAALIDVDGGEPRALTGLLGHVLLARFSPDGERLLTLTDDGAAQLWSGADGRPQGRLRGPTRGRGRLGAVFSPGGDGLALIGPDGVEIVRAGGGRGRRLAVGESLRDGSFSADDAAFLTVDGDGIVRRYGDEGPLGRLELVGHDDAVGGARFLAGGELLVGTPFGGAIWLWSAAERGSPLLLRGHASSVTAVVASDSGGRILSIAHEDPQARVWRLGDDPAVRRGHDGVIERLRWSGDGQAIVSAAMDGTARVWPREGGAPIVLRRHAEESSVVAELHPGGRLLATASTDGSARIWRLDEGGPVAVATLGGASGRPGRGAPAGLVDLAWSPGGGRLAVAADDGALHLWPIAEDGRPSPIETMSLGTGPISHVRWVSDEDLLIVDGSGQLHRVRVRPGGAPAAERVAGHDGAVRDLVVAIDGRRAASAGADGQALVLDLEGGRPPRPLRHDGPALWAVAFDPGGSRLVTGGADGSARIWALDRPDEAPEILRGHTQAVLAVAFAPSGDVIVTGGADGEARIWRKRQVPEDMSEWTSVRLPHAGTWWPGERDRSVWTVAWSPDGALVATGAADGTLRVFPVEIDALIAEACDRIGRELTEDERARVELGPAATPRCGRRRR